MVLRKLSVTLYAIWLKVRELNFSSFMYYWAICLSGCKEFGMLVRVLNRIWLKIF